MRKQRLFRMATRLGKWFSRRGREGAK